MRGLKSKYEDTLKEKKRATIVEEIENNPEAVQIHALPAKKRGRPVALGEHLDQQVQAYICAIHSAGAVVNTAIICESSSKRDCVKYQPLPALSVWWPPYTFKGVGQVCPKAYGFCQKMSQHKSQGQCRRLRPNEGDFLSRHQSNSHDGRDTT